MNAPDFHAERLTGLGSSDAAAACGVSRFRSRLDVYLEKRGEVARVDEPNEPQRFGKLLEPIVVAEFARRTSIRVEPAPPMIRSKAYPFMIAHLDAEVTPTLADAIAKQYAIVEAKCSRTGEGFGEAGTADVPIDYLVQTHHQMICAGAVIAYVPVLIAGMDFRIYEVPFDPELGEMIVENESRLWDQIQRGEPPEVDPQSPDALRLIRKLYPGTNGEILRASGTDESWRTVYHDAVAKRDKYSTAADCAKAHLLLTMGEAALLEFADGQSLRRKQVEVKGYTVEPRTQIDARFIKPKD